MLRGAFPFLKSLPIGRRALQHSECRMYPTSEYPALLQMCVDMQSAS